MVLLCTAAYYAYGITAPVSWGIFAVLVVFGGWLFQKRPTGNKEEQTVQKNSSFFFLLSILSIIIDLTLITILVANRTDGLLPSPWQTLEPWFFLLFALGSACVFFTKNPLIMALHFFVMLSVAPILYQLGFGFDAFVHRATESWIYVHGFILPKTPYYIGQYSVITFLAHMTRIPLFYLDVFLVPALAALTLPATVLATGRKPFVFWLIPFIPFLSLHLTTPHNLVILYALLIVFTSSPKENRAVPIHVPILLALAALATHPLLGAPLVVFVAGSLFKHRLNQLFTCLGMAFVTPILFFLNNLRVGAEFPHFANPITQFPAFIALLARPYWYLKHAPLRFEVLYAWQWLIVPIVLGLALYGLFRKKEYSFLSGALGLISSAWLLTSWFVFPDVISYEQGDYPLRLLKASIVFLLPLAMTGLNQILSTLNAKRVTLFAAIAALLLMLSLYFSYPQRNIKARFPGYNVTASDFRAVEWIHGRHSEYDYIVLSNQLVSAAALTNYSFAKYYETKKWPLFYYALPTGGELYAYYGKMIYEGQKREYMEEAMALAGVDTAYFVVNSYWANSEKIIDGAKKTADSFESFDGGAVWVFVYHR